MELEELRIHAHPLTPMGLLHWNPLGASVAQVSRLLARRCNAESWYGDNVSY